MRQISLLCRIVLPQTLRFARILGQLAYRLGELFAYLESNRGSTIAYGKHYREHKPVSTAMAESAVNPVVNARMCKRQHMRWMPRGARLLAQVRCAVINGDLAARLASTKYRRTCSAFSSSCSGRQKRNPTLFNSLRLSLRLTGKPL
jgi:hypothetical protein